MYCIIKGSTNNNVTLNPTNRPSRKVIQCDCRGGSMRSEVTPRRRSPCWKTEVYSCSQCWIISLRRGEAMACEELTAAMASAEDVNVPTLSCFLRIFTKLSHSD